MREWVTWVIAYIEEHLWGDIFHDLLEFLQGDLSPSAEHLFYKFVDFILTFYAIDKQVPIW